MKKTHVNINIIFISIAFTITCSCVNTAKTAYFNNLGDSILQSPDSLVPTIHKNDLLSISVGSSNPEASKIFNDPNLTTTISSNANGLTQQTIGYLVASD